MSHRCQLNFVHKSTRHCDRKNPLDTYLSSKYIYLPTFLQDIHPRLLAFQMYQLQYIFRVLELPPFFQFFLTSMVWSAVKPSVCQDFSEKLGRLFFEFQSSLMAAFLTDRKGAK